jgi:[acyl-carrier-protein] S-malonyltransferase
MRPAAEIMKEKINKIKINDPIVPIIYNVTAKPKKQSDEIKNLLIDQIVSTVKWRESIINMSKAGITNFIEVGPGKVLSGMVKRTIKNANCFSINSIADMQKLTNDIKR